MRQKYPERQIKSISELIKVIESLDSDDGVRLLGDIENFQGGGFIFISTVHSLIKSNHKYCINVTERILSEEPRIYLPGGKEEYHYTSNVKDVINYIEENASKPLKAWYY